MKPDSERSRLVEIGESVGFVDAEGTSWLVTERATPAVPGARGVRCLIFMSEHVCRRVWEYPVAWRALVPEALAELSWRR